MVIQSTAVAAGVVVVVVVECSSLILKEARKANKNQTSKKQNKQCQ